MSEDVAGTESDYIKLVPVIWTALRLMGVWVFIIGVAATIDDVATMIAQQTENAYAPLGRSEDDPILPRLLGDVIWTLAGMYLLFGGRWLIENVFLPAKAPEPIADDVGAGSE
jgi:hypothetical protein